MEAFLILTKTHIYYIVGVHKLNINIKLNKRMKKKILLFVLLITLGLISILLFKQRHLIWQGLKDKRELAQMNIAPVANYPIKTAAYWTSPTMGERDALNLARHDLLIIDLENKFNNRYRLLEIKKMNPDIIILAYSNPMEIFTTLYQTRPWQNKVIKEITEKRPAWLLKTVSQERQSLQFANFWPGMIMLNISATCPRINGERYYQWMAKKLKREILSDPIFDGYFQDNGTVNISWVYQNKPEKIDINSDNQPDSDAFIDKSWSKGQNRFLRSIHGYSFWRNLFRSRKMLILSNKGDTNLLKYVDGKFFEKFPNDYLGDKWAFGWGQSMSNARKTGPYTILQVERHLLQFGLASTLLLDNAYIAVGQDNAGVFPEFEIDPGKPRGQSTSYDNLYARDYENLRVEVDPLLQKSAIIMYSH